MVLSLFLVGSTLGAPPADEAKGRVPLEGVCILLGRELLVVVLNTDLVGLELPIRPDAAARFDLSSLEICTALLKSPLS